MAYRHGVYISETPTNMISPIKAENSMPVFFVTAPVNLAIEPYKVTNIPKLLYNYKEAVDCFGFSLKHEIWNDYTACQVIYSQFALYAVAPIVIINVLNPKKHKETVNDYIIKLNSYTGIIDTNGVLIDTVKIKKSNNEYYEEGKHFTLSFDTDGYVSINIKNNSENDINENSEILIEYDKINPKKVDIYDVIGGYNSLTGKSEGLELMSEIYPRFRIVPGQIVVPGFSANPSVAAVMDTKAGNINGHFKCIAINDIPTISNEDSLEKISKTSDKENNYDIVEIEENNILYETTIKSEENIVNYLKYTAVGKWKNENNYISERQYNCYPKVKLGEQLFFYSTQMAGLICKTDAENENIPYNSPSNKKLKINGLCYENGEEVVLNNEQANYLNSNGIVTAINFVNGWTTWGNRTGAYPHKSDVKDTIISIRRMFDWISNSIVLTYWSKIDYPLTRRMIETIVDSINIWFNGLAAREFILGGKIEFLESENPTTDLIDGIAKFHVYVTPPSPMIEADFILEYDVDYLSKLFG